MQRALLPSVAILLALCSQVSCAVFGTKGGGTTELAIGDPKRAQPCAADHGSSTACCLQPTPGAIKPTNTCPQDYPTCVGYVHGGRYGHCENPAQAVTPATRTKAPTASFGSLESEFPRTADFVIDCHEKMPSSRCVGQVTPLVHPWDLARRTSSDRSTALGVLVNNAFTDGKNRMEWPVGDAPICQGGHFTSTSVSGQAVSVDLSKCPTTARWGTTPKTAGKNTWTKTVRPAKCPVWHGCTPSAHSRRMMPLTPFRSESPQICEWCPSACPPCPPRQSPLSRRMC
jgi:hypothetical protein